MNKLILLVVGAAWAAVLLPPLLRSRLDKWEGSRCTWRLFSLVQAHALRA